MKDQFELINLRKGKRAPFPTMLAALEAAERRALHDYRIIELTPSGSVVRLQVGSSSSS